MRVFIVVVVCAFAALFYSVAAGGASGPQGSGSESEGGRKGSSNDRAKGVKSGLLLQQLCKNKTQVQSNVVLCLLCEGLSQSCFGSAGGSGSGGSGSGGSGSGGTKPGGSGPGGPNSGDSGATGSGSGDAKPGNADNGGAEAKAL